MPTPLTPERKEQIAMARLRFFAAMGMTICSWQEIEVLLFELYGRFMRGADQGLVSAAFHSTLNFGIRLDATDAAARTGLASDKGMAILQSWTGLYGKLNKRSKARNAVVHYHLYLDDKTKKSERMFFLAPNYYDIRSDWDFYSQHPQKLFLKNLEDISSSFIQLQDDMRAFIEMLPKLPRRRVPYPLLRTR